MVEHDYVDADLLSIDSAITLPQVSKKKPHPQHTRNAQCVYTRRRANSGTQWGRGPGSAIRRTLYVRHIATSKPSGIRHIWVDTNIHKAAATAYHVGEGEHLLNSIFADCCSYTGCYAREWIMIVARASRTRYKQLNCFLKSMLMQCFLQAFVVCKISIYSMMLQSSCEMPTHSIILFKIRYMLCFFVTVMLIVDLSILQWGIAKWKRLYILCTIV